MVFGGTKWKKKRVSVMSVTDPEGVVTPLSIIWDDGRIFDISMPENRGMQASEHLGEYVHEYLVTIKHSKKRLYKDSLSWFVEVPQENTTNTGKWPPDLLWDPEA